MAPLPRLGKSELLILVSPFASVISQCYTRPTGLLVLQTHTPEYRLAGACWPRMGFFPGDDRSNLPTSDGPADGDDPKPIVSGPLQNEW